MTTVKSKFGKLSTKDKPSPAQINQEKPETASLLPLEIPLNPSPHARPDDVPLFELEPPQRSSEEAQAPEPRAFNISNSPDVQTDSSADLEPSETGDEQGPKRGRPATGKRSSEDFKRVTVYLNKKTLRDARRKLFEQERDELESSELLEEALKFWIERA